MIKLEKEYTFEGSKGSAKLIDLFEGRTQLIIYHFMFKLGKYKDVIEFKSNDHRVMTSHMVRDDGQWQQFMTAHY